MTRDNALHLLNRVLKIVKTLVAQVDVLETMTPAAIPVLPRSTRPASGSSRRVSARSRPCSACAMPPPPHAQPEGPTARRAIEAGPGGSVGLGFFLAYLGARGPRRPLPDARPSPDARVQEIVVAVYRGDPDAAFVAERLVDLDEGVQEWRYRHVKMVERTIGTKSGTGGTTGVEYLRATLFRPAFPDLWENPASGCDRDPRPRYPVRRL